MKIKQKISCFLLGYTPKIIPVSLLIICSSAKIINFFWSLLVYKYINYQHSFNKLVIFQVIHFISWEPKSKEDGICVFPFTSVRPNRQYMPSFLFDLVKNASITAITIKPSITTLSSIHLLLLLLFE